jgi:hypothetical protein
LAVVRCELTAGGTGAVYPHPDLTFTVLDEEFAGALRAAWEYARSLLAEPDHHDLRWHVALDRAAPPERLYGPSLGGALALAAAKAAIGYP